MEGKANLGGSGQGGGYLGGRKITHASNSEPSLISAAGHSGARFIRLVKYILPSQGGNYQKYHILSVFPNTHDRCKLLGLHPRSIRPIIQICYASSDRQ